MHPYFSYPRDSLGAECPEFESVKAAGCRRVPRFAVGAALTLAVKRARFIGRFIYWTVRHRSTANAAWVCNYEGYSWN